MRKHTVEVKTYLKKHPKATPYRVAKELGLHPRHTALVMDDLKGQTKTEVLTTKEVLKKFKAKTMTPKVARMLKDLGYEKVKAKTFPFAVTYEK